MTRTTEIIGKVLYIPAMILLICASVELLSAVDMSGDHPFTIYILSKLVLSLPGIIGFSGLMCGGIVLCESWR